MSGEKKQRVLFVSDFYYPHWTGLSKSLYNFIQAIKDQFVITVLTVQHDKKLKLEEKIDSVRVIREPYVFTISRSKYSVSMIFKFLTIVHLYDSVFVNSPCANIFLISLLAKVFGKKLFIFHQGDLTLPKGIINRIIEEIFNVFSFFSFSLADKTSTYTLDYAKNSRVLKQFLHKFFPLLPLIYIQPSKSRRKKRGKNEELLFGFAGRFVEEKGFDILFAAIKKVKVRFPHARFLFAGETHMPYENFFDKNLELYERVKKDIEFKGLLDDKKLVEFYRQVDFIIIPSRTDCFNLVQAEAMVAGTACITSNIPGLRFMIKETGFGVLFRKGDADDLADKIFYAIEHRDEIMVSYTKVLRLLHNTANAAKIREFITI